MNDHGIEEPDFDFYKASKPFYPNGGDIQVPTLIINVDVCDDVSIVGWLPASGFLDDLLSKSGYRGICMKIQDRNRHFQPSLFPLSPGDSTAKSYESVRKVLIEKLGKGSKFLLNVNFQCQERLSRSYACDCSHVATSR